MKKRVVNDAFSLLHTDAYSTIGLQEANIYEKYPSIYWVTANLISMSESYEQEEVKDEFFKVKEKTTNYGKVATAISRVQLEGTKVELPNINESELGFIPNEKDNSILFGLKAISGINNETVNNIIKNRPYNNLADFQKKLVDTKVETLDSNGKVKKKSLVSLGQTITLIKAGAFDKLENKDRTTILEDYLHLNFPNKKSVTMQNINKIIEMGIVTEEYKIYIRYYNFKKYISSFKNKTKEKDSNVTWVLIKEDNEEDTEMTIQFLCEHFTPYMEEDKGYRYTENGELEIALNTDRKGSFNKVYNDYMATFKKWLNSKEFLNLYNTIQFNEIKNKYMVGNPSSWEMESLSMYYGEHELANVNKDKYDIVNFFELEETPKVIGYNEYKNVQYPKYELVRIAGTVLDRNKNKHMVTLLTTDGVVTLKFYKGQFNFYDKTNSTIDEITGEKIKLEEGWFKKGTKLLVTGYRRNDVFAPKKYKNSIFRHTLQKINKVLDNGDLELQSDRIKEGE